jgi:hypothetical protein
MSDNLNILYNIIEKDFLFPHADILDNNTFKLKLYQAILPYLEKNETNTSLSIDKKTIQTKYPDLYTKLSNLKPDNENDEIGKQNLLKNDDYSIHFTFDLGLIRNLTNYFTSNYGSVYNKYITLHYLINKDIIEELSSKTFGQYVLYTDGYYYIPQPIPNKFLKTIIIDGEKLSEEDISKLRKKLDEKGLNHVNIEEKSITTFTDKDKDKIIENFNESFRKKDFFSAESFACDLVGIYSSEKNTSEAEKWRKRGDIAYQKYTENIKKEQEEQKTIDRIRKPTIASSTRKEGGGKIGRSK